MRAVALLPGDVVVCEQGVQPRQGDVVAALVDGACAARLVDAKRSSGGPVSRRRDATGQRREVGDSGRCCPGRAVARAVGVDSQLFLARAASLGTIPRCTAHGRSPHFQTAIAHQQTLCGLKH
jgi:hypothetical protein